jgi:flavin reductase (DIM6/NTAB) family NADH-FMN oxidoreductase RutF
LSGKVKIGAVPLLYPIPIVLAGAKVNGKANYATLGDCGIMGLNPALTFVSLHANHYTTQGILENKTFSINIPSTELLAEVDYCGMVSGRQVDKARLFDTFYGELGTAPLIRECPVNLECRVVHDFSIEHRQIFVGKVIQTHIDDSLVNEENGRWVFADLTRLDPIVYALDNHYYRIGGPIGTGYSVGQPLRDQTTAL